jgi:hypothetical protein
MRAALFLALLLALSACAGLAEQVGYSFSGTSGESADFGVSALAAGPLPASHATLNKVDPQIADLHARQICTLGYDKLEERTMPYDPGQLAFWRVRCAPYVLTAF